MFSINLITYKFCKRFF